MSIHVSSFVWKNARARGNAKLLLLALADMANDEGVCWPSIRSLMDRINVSTERAVQLLLCDLEKNGEITREFVAGKPTHYRILTSPVASQPTQIKKQGVNGDSPRIVIRPEQKFGGGVKAHSPQGVNNGSPPLAPSPPDLPSPLPPREPSEGTVSEPERECARRRATASRLPEQFAPPALALDWATREHPGVDAAAETEAFRDYWQANATAAARKLDWVAAWRTWIRHAGQYAAQRSVPARASPNGTERRAPVGGGSPSRPGQFLTTADARDAAFRAELAAEHADRLRRLDTEMDTAP